MTSLVLASASPRRHELLSALVREFEIKVADVDETLGDDPIADAVRLASAKARRIGSETPTGSVVLGADTIVFDDRRSFGKPADPKEAQSMLHELAGRPHSVVTAVAVITEGNRLADHVISRVTLTPLGDEAIASYVASGRPLDKAGSYAIQDYDVPTVSRIAGCRCGVIGLPLWRVRRLFEAAGIASRRPDSTYPRCAGCPSRRLPPLQV
ncbi:MAG TPA: Maf family protein [Dehalococcoidia bacterium]|nr:Maf family protein [Dehalococcoidia bacterium]